MDKIALGEQVEVMAKAAEMAARETDASGHLSAAFLDAVRSSQVTAAMLPAELGGIEQGAAYSARVIRTVSRRCASSGLTLAWYIGFPWLVSQFPRGFSEPLLSSRQDVLIAGALMPRGTYEVEDTGVRIQGWWPFASGVGCADWVALAVGGDSGRVNTAEDILVTCVPVADVEVDRHWDALGMRGTESHGVSIDSPLKVSRASCVRMSDLLTGTHLASLDRTLPSYNIPYDIMTLVGLAACAVGTLESFVGLEETRRRHQGHERLLESSRTAGMKLEKLCIALDRFSEERFLSRIDAEKTRASAADITNFCMQQIVLGSVATGTAALSRRLNIERHVRDIVTLASHILFKQTP